MGNRPRSLALEALIDSASPALSIGRTQSGYIGLPTLRLHRFVATGKYSTQVSIYLQESSGTGRSQCHGCGLVIMNMPKGKIQRMCNYAVVLPALGNGA